MVSENVGLREQACHVNASNRVIIEKNSLEGTVSLICHQLKRLNGKNHKSSQRNFDVDNFGLL